MNKTNLDDFYKNRVDQIEKLAKHLKHQHNTLGLIKLILIAAGITAILRIFSKDITISMEILGGIAALFLCTAWIHETIIRKLDFQNALKTINENEIKYLDHQFALTDNGKEYSNGDHPYTSDLDIFGEKGLFHFINRSSTTMGKQCLASWLQTHANKDEIKKRQEGASELCDKIDFRQRIAAHSIFIDDSSQKLDGLIHLMNQPFLVSGKKLLLCLIYIWPIITLTAFVLIFFNVPAAAFFALFLSQLAVNAVFFKRVSKIYTATRRTSKVLKGYSQIILEIENQEFTGAKCKELKQQLGTGTGKASQKIRRLSTLLEWFDARNSTIHFFINNILFWDLHLVYRVEKWRKETSPFIHGWFEVIGEFETLSSFACLLFNHKDWALPEICGESFILEAKELGHPLIRDEERIDNDVHIDGKNGGHVMLVTGPNMAGKSTFLRTVGVNIALALAGSPVCSKNFRISEISLFTSLQTSDSLDKHLSLFYAELQRLKMILDGVNREKAVFFLVDEMLKGTNTLDRQKGALALIKQFIRLKASGIVATHDLELTKLEETGKDRISNYHFDSTIKNDALIFDYKLKDGICTSFNALVLMKKMGIEV